VIYITFFDFIIHNIPVGIEKYENIPEFSCGIFPYNSEKRDGAWLADSIYPAAATVRIGSFSGRENSALASPSSTLEGGDASC